MRIWTEHHYGTGPVDYIVKDSDVAIDLSKGSVAVVLTDQSGKVVAVPLVSDTRLEVGRFSVSLPALPDGDYVLATTLVTPPRPPVRVMTNLTVGRNPWPLIKPPTWWQRHVSWPIKRFVS